jgi:hypothetical protein
MDMDFPQEEEYGMVNIQPASLYNFFQFPGDFNDIVQRETAPGRTDLQHTVTWMKEYQLLMKKAGLNTGGSRYIGKNPCNLGRIKLLKEMFPQAKFIFIFRNPYRVVESLYRFYLSIIPGVQLQRLPPDFSRENVVHLYVRMMERYYADKEILPDQDLVEIKMENFLKDKAGFLAGIYKVFSLGSFDAAWPYMEEYLKENTGYSREAYDIHPDTFTLVNRYAADIVKRLGYPLQTGA